MSIDAVLVGVVVVSALVGVIAFVRGDQARRRAQGLAGPRPARSIGEALRLALEHAEGRALVVFLGDDAASAEAGSALAGDPDVMRLLSDAALPHVVVRSGGEEREVAQVLLQKYARQALPEGPVCLLLDGRGQVLAAALDPGPLPSWLPGWLAAAPRPCVTPAGPEVGPAS